MPANKGVTKAECKEMNERYANEEGATQASLAEDYGLSQPGVRYHLDGIGDDECKHPDVSGAECDEMREAYADGDVSQADLAEEFGVAQSTVHLHLKGDCVHGPSSSADESDSDAEPAESAA